MKTRTILLASFALALAFLRSDLASAHCDGLDGPVVKAARKALETGDPNYVLVWVKKDDEAALRAAFERTLAVRKTGGEARDLADTWFFETLVRIHRTGEGAPYTGLKPAGRDLGPVIPAADKALESGSEEELVKMLLKEVEAGVREHFKAVREKKDFKPADVAAGREYVEAYVQYVHFAEGIHQAATRAATGHFEEEGTGAGDEHH